MKFFLTLLFLLNWIIIFAQEYKFIEKCEILPSIIKSSKTEYSNFLYRGDKSPLVYMTEVDKTYQIKDRINNLRHFFNLNVHADTLIMQNYTTSAIIAHNPEREIKKSIVKKIGENTYSIKTYPRLKAKRSNLEIIFTLKKSDFALVQIHFLDLSTIIQDQIYKELLEELDGNINYQIEKIDLDYKNGYQFIYEIKNCQKVNWKINI